MTRAEQAQDGRVIDVAQLVEAHGVQALQRQPLAVLEVQRNVDGLDELQIDQCRDECLRLLEPGVDLAQRALNRAQ